MEIAKCYGCRGMVTGGGLSVLESPIIQSIPHPLNCLRIVSQPLGPNRFLVPQKQDGRLFKISVNILQVALCRDQSLSVKVPPPQ